MMSFVSSMPRRPSVIASPILGDRVPIGKGPAMPGFSYALVSQFYRFSGSSGARWRDPCATVRPR